MFSKELIEAIRSVSEVILSDLEEEFCRDPDVVAETTLDANRLTMFGHPEADAELHELLREHDWNTVITEAKKHVHCL